MIIEGAIIRLALQKYLYQCIHTYTYRNMVCSCFTRSERYIPKAATQSQDHEAAAKAAKAGATEHEVHHHHAHNVFLRAGAYDAGFRAVVTC